jgi:hypothetical protein
MPTNASSAAAPATLAFASVRTAPRANGCDMLKLCRRRGVRRTDDERHAEELLGRLGPGQLAAVVHLL